jgi:hypothetical protein
VSHAFCSAFICKTGPSPFCVVVVHHRPLFGILLPFSLVHGHILHAIASFVHRGIEPTLFAARNAGLRASIPTRSCVPTGFATGHSRIFQSHSLVPFLLIEKPDGYNVSIHECCSWKIYDRSSIGKTIRKQLAAIVIASAVDLFAKDRSRSIRLEKSPCLAHTTTSTNTKIPRKSLY